MSDAEIPVGRVTRPHGLRGALVVRPESEDSDVLLRLQRVVALNNGKRLSLEIREARMQGKFLLLSFEGYADRNAADVLIGATLLVRADELPPEQPGEFYVSRLIGLPVVAPSGQALGKVVEVETSAGRSWLVVETPVGQRLVPFTEPLARVEMEQKRVVVDAPEGLLD